MTAEIEPIFHPDEWGLTKKQAELCTKARALAAETRVPSAVRCGRVPSAVAIDWAHGLNSFLSPNFP